MINRHDFIKAAIAGPVAILSGSGVAIPVQRFSGPRRTINLGNGTWTLSTLQKWNFDNTTLLTFNANPQEQTRESESRDSGGVRPA